MHFIVSKNSLYSFFIIFQSLFAAAFLYFLYNSLFFFIRDIIDVPSITRLSSPIFLFYDRLLYAAVYLLGGFFFFHKLFLHPCTDFAWEKKGKMRKAEKTKKTRKARAAFAWGFFTGTGLFLIIFFFSLFFETFFFDTLPSKKEENLEEILQSSKAALAWHLFFSAWVTAFLEETFYRGCLQNYLESNTVPILGVLISTVVFGLVHSQSLPIMLLPALVFSLTFQKLGLLSSFTAHGVYNTLVLVTAAAG